MKTLSEIKQEIISVERTLESATYNYRDQGFSEKQIEALRKAERLVNQARQLIHEVQ